MRISNTTFTFKIISSISLFLLLWNCKNQPELPDPHEAGWNNQVICEVVEDNDKLRTLKCTFPPGVGHERHYHNAHYGYTVSGSKFRIKDTTGTREVNVPSGYSFYNDKIEWHEVLNIGDSTAVFLIVEPK
ncbi:cupin domain-containing protein [Psychroserpens ponticola]|uniref:Cupin domain-containing protein n=1 Tax=Psychroserpens ponticola TaxID=2932268 RepID=A0ABY7S145_9FLAO|nr:cupin domain-containing protein [Psychroserpens ponticola]WCO02720.1 cupin domain-containing protein [Psychroserpens ponticola]